MVHAAPAAIFLTYYNFINYALSTAAFSGPAGKGR
jgi:hypothetical protein